MKGKIKTHSQEINTGRKIKEQKLLEDCKEKICWERTWKGECRIKDKNKKEKDRKGIKEMKARR